RARVQDPDVGLDPLDAGVAEDRDTVARLDPEPGEARGDCVARVAPLAPRAPSPDASRANAERRPSRAPRDLSREEAEEGLAHRADRSVADLDARGVVHVEHERRELEHELRLEIDADVAVEAE